MIIYFDKNIRYLRKLRKVSQEALGEVIGKEKGTISGYERGVSKPNFENLIQLAQYFDVSIDSLIHEDLSKNGIPDYPELTPQERQDAFDKYQDKMPEDMREAIRGMIAEELEKYKEEKDSQ